MTPVILDLCGGTGSWSKPYRDAGYDVRVITLPEWNILEWQSGSDQWHHIREMMRNGDIYGILAAPPCTMFSFARTNAKTPRNLSAGMECVKACLGIIWECMEVTQGTNKKTIPLQFWALENPYHGFLKKFLGKPASVFNPWEFGDGYKKKTALWGHFNEPIKTHFEKPNVSKFDKLKTKEIHPEFYGTYDRQTRRAVTPEGFAKAFFKANL